MKIQAVNLHVYRLYLLVGPNIKRQPTAMLLPAIKEK
jgi:hypothetical protein